MTGKELTTFGAELLRLTLPWPDKRLSPNARIDRRAKAEIIRDNRQIGYIIANENKDGRDYTAISYHLRIVFYPPDTRKRDLDNMFASMKPAIDGICDALGINDMWIVSASLVKAWCKPGGEVLVTLSSLDG